MPAVGSSQEEVHRGNHLAGDIHSRPADNKHLVVEVVLVDMEQVVVVLYIDPTSRLMLITIKHGSMIQKILYTFDYWYISDLFVKNITSYLANSCGLLTDHLRTIN